MLRDRKDLDGATAAYREAIRLDSKYTAAHNGLGNALRVKGDPDAAEACYREAIRLDPSYANPHNGLGMVYEQHRFHLARAEASYRETIRLDPRLAQAHANLGNLLRKQARHAEAVAAYRAALATTPMYVSARAGLDYCERVLRGEVPTAPPPRAVTRSPHVTDLDVLGGAVLADGVYVG